MREIGKINRREQDELLNLLSSSDSNTLAQSEVVQAHLDVERLERLGDLRENRLGNILTQDSLNAPSSDTSSSASSS